MSADRRFHTGLVRQAQRGDDQAVREVLSRAEPMLRAFFVARIGNRSEVDDMVQNTLLRIHRGLPDLNDVRRLKSFSMKAAVFELQDFYRGRYRGKERLFDAEDLPDGRRHETSSDAAIDVRRMLGVLSDKARRIIEMRELGFRYEEIARHLDTTEAAVKMQVKRAFERIRDAYPRQ